MKEKILAALKTKFSNLGFTDKEFTAAAEFLTASVTEDSQIETAVSGVEPLLKTFQSFADARVTTAIAEAKPKEAQPGGGAQPAAQPATPAATTDPAILELLNKLNTRLDGIENKGVVTDRKTMLENALATAPKAYKDTILANFPFMNFADEAAFNTYLESTKTGSESFTKTLNEEGLTKIPGPTISAKAAEPGKPAGKFSAEFTEMVDEKLASQQAK